MYNILLRPPYKGCTQEFMERGKVFKIVRDVIIVMDEWVIVLLGMTCRCDYCNKRKRCRVVKQVLVLNAI